MKLSHLISLFSNRLFPSSIYEGEWYWPLVNIAVSLIAMVGCMSIDVSIEMLQLLLRLGTFQLSDIFYNTVGGVIGGLMYCAVMKARKRL